MALNRLGATATSDLKSCAQELCHFPDAAAPLSSLFMAVLSRFFQQLLQQDASFNVQYESILEKKTPLGQGKKPVLRARPTAFPPFAHFFPKNCKINHFCTKFE